MALELENLEALHPRDGRTKSLRWVNAGGQTTLGDGQSNNPPTSARIINVGPGDPTNVAIQLASVVTGLNAAGSLVGAVGIYAKVDWQTGRGTQTAIVDVGRGTVFTLAAAESVSVTIFAGQNSFSVDSNGNPIPAPITVADSQFRAKVFGCAAPASALASIPASLSMRMNPGVSPFNVPLYASGLTLLCSTEAAYSVVEAQFAAALDGTVTMYRALATSGKIPVHNWATTVVINTTDGSGPSVWGIWELAL